MVSFHYSLVQCENLTDNFLQGQCVWSSRTDRHEGYRLGYLEFCQNLRDIQYMCESVRRKSQPLWTIDGGYCLPYRLNYQTLHLDTTLTNDMCNFSIRCALSDSLNKDCHCKNLTQCHNSIINSCMNEFLFYPSLGVIISPYAHMMYVRNHDWTKKKPDGLAFYGELKCLGYQFRTKRWFGKLIEESSEFYDYKEIENYLCGIKEGNNGHRDSSGPHYDVSCWNNSKTFNNRSYQVSFLCRTRCISKYRVRDGIDDCFFAEESHDINNSCPQIQHHRLQCSESELSCLLVGALGNGGSDCRSKRDEIDYQSGRILLGNMHCSTITDAECHYFQKYIQMSSNKDVEDLIFNEDFLRANHSKRVIPFRSYCDSFFNLEEGFDELAELCEQ